jgi:predicted phage terminase large subunit-like protein
LRKAAGRINDIVLKHSPHKPSQKQLAFLLAPEREILFGGAAGGGKSDALLMAALQYVDVPGYAALIVRKQRVTLKMPGGLIDRAKGWLRELAVWDEANYTFRFPSGATLTFGYLERPNDVYRYQSTEFQFIGFEELGEFKKSADYMFLFSRLRKGNALAGNAALASVPLRMVATANPIGPGFGWVRERFVQRKEKEGAAADTSIRFIPSLLTDNPGLDKESYRQSLAKLPEFVRKKLENGDWSDMRAGEFFKVDSIGRIVPADVPPLAQFAKLVRFWDLAGTLDGGDETIGIKLGITHTGAVLVLDIVSGRLNPAEVEALVLQTAKLDGPEVHIAMEQEPGQSGKSQIVNFSKLLAGFSFKGIPSDENKITRAAAISSQVSNGNVYLIAGLRNEGAFLEQLDLFPFGEHDDKVDGFSGAYNFALIAPETIAPGRKVLGPRLR